MKPEGLSRPQAGVGTTLKTHPIPPLKGGGKVQRSELMVNGRSATIGDDFIAKRGKK